MSNYPLIVGVPETEWIITRTDLEEVEEMLKRMQRVTGPSQPRFIIGRITYYWDSRLAGLAASAMLASALQPMVESLLGTDQKTQRRRRTKLCAWFCLSILQSGFEDVKNIMEYRALQTDDNAPRARRRFKSRKS